jgi:hypothetical protein
MTQGPVSQRRMIRIERKPHREPRSVWLASSAGEDSMGDTKIGEDLYPPKMWIKDRNRQKPHEFYPRSSGENRTKYTYRIDDESCCDSCQDHVLLAVFCYGDVVGGAATETFSLRSLTISSARSAALAGIDMVMSRFLGQDEDGASLEPLSSSVLCRGAISPLGLHSRPDVSQEQALE